MLSQLLGAVVRASLVCIVVATPSLVLPGMLPDGAQMVMIVALALAIFVLFEYGAAAPAWIEFRDAPPFNRVRVLSLLVTLFCLSTVASAPGNDSTLVLVLVALGLLVARALDAPFSPLQLMAETVPDDASAAIQLQVASMVGLAVLIALVSLTVFVILIRLQRWPNRGRAFNVWTNLPNFDAIRGGDVVSSLAREARVNTLLGFTLPFLIPLAASWVSSRTGLNLPASPHLMVWGISLWMFLPLCLLMRGLALARIARLIHLRLSELTGEPQGDAPSQLAWSQRG